LAWPLSRRVQVPETVTDHTFEAALALPSFSDISANVSLKSGSTLNDAREIYVGYGYHRFTQAFDRCDSAGRVSASFAFVPFFIGFIWFFYRKMYLEGFIFLSVSLLIRIGDFLYRPPMALLVSVYVIYSVLVAITAKGLYWQSVDRHIEAAMRRFPHDPDEALEWLWERGGGGALMAALSVVIFAALLIGVAGLFFFTSLASISDF